MHTTLQTLLSTLNVLELTELSKSCTAGSGRLSSILYTHTGFSERGKELDLRSEIFLSEDRMVLENLPDQKSNLSVRPSGPSQSEGLNHALFEADPP